MDTTATCCECEETHKDNKVQCSISSHVIAMATCDVNPESQIPGDVRHWEQLSEQRFNSQTRQF